MKNALAIIGILLILLAVGLLATPVISADKCWYSPTGAYRCDKDIGATDAPAVYVDDFVWNKMFASGLRSAQPVTDDFIHIIVDVGDTINFPHNTRSTLFLKDITGTICLDADTGQWEVLFGLVTSQDGDTSGVVHYFDSHIFTGKGCHPFPRSPNHYPPAGLKLTTTAGIPDYYSTLTLDAATVTWSTTPNYISFAGTYVKVGVGDIVLLLNETTDGADLDFSIGMIYRGE